MRWIPALAAPLLLAACEAAVEVDGTAHVTARYDAVLVTVEEVWFNESATAAPADDTWEKFRLDDARTLNLADMTNGSLTSIADDLLLPSGNWRQIRLLLAGTHDGLHDSAEELDADHNNEVRWFDEDGEQRTAPLEVLNPAQGIGIELALKVVVDTGGSTPLNTVQVAFDAARDLTEFRYGSRTGFLLNPAFKAFEVGDAGTIRGTLDLSQLDIDDAGTGRPDIQVLAQRRDATLQRYVLVGSGTVARTGAYVLYPLPLDEDEAATEYDLVISGPGIQTVVVRDVPVSEGMPADAQAITASITLQPADSYEANLRAEEPLLPAGARVGFYQTLPGEDESHLVAMASPDPLVGRFALPVVLSRAGSLSWGTYGSGFTLRTVTPEEGASRYAVAALSPHQGAGAFADTTLRPASPVSDTALFSVPAIGIAAPAIEGTITATVTVENPGAYDRGMLLVTREGAVVAAAPLDQMLQQQLGSTFVDVAPVPAGAVSAELARGLYHLEAWAWNSSDPADSFARHEGAGAIDLRASANASGAVTIR